MEEQRISNLTTYETPKILLQDLICTFCLSISLGMVAGGQFTRDLENCEEMLPKFRYKLQSTVIVVGRTMVTKNLTHNEIFGVFSTDIFSA